MEIIDFLPKYPNINQTNYPVLNPYEKDFYEAIFHKKEFYELKLDRVEIFPKERGMLTRYQNTIARYMSSNTPYDRLLLVHQMGLGKTCSAIGAIEQIKQEENTFDGALILAKGEGMLDNFTNELVEKCTAGQYIPENYSTLTDLEKAHRIKKKIKFYDMDTFTKFAKKLEKTTDSDITANYSNKVVVIDEVHNLRPQDKEGTLEIYNQIHRFLHLINNSKVIFLSGTPMKDGPEEIATVANLLLGIDEQLPTGDIFLKEFMMEDEGVYYINPGKVQFLKDKLKGKISFLREPESTVPKEFIGDEKIGNLKHFIVQPNKMSTFQTKGYKKAFEEDKEGKKGVYINSREASLFVYPDGSYGREGFKKYIEEIKIKKILKVSKQVSFSSRYKMSNDLVKALKGNTNDETLEKVRKYSSTYADVIKQILDTSGNCFVYSSLAQGSGGILFSLILELFGFSKATGKETEPNLRYAILTNKTATTTELRRITARYNKQDNMKGEYIKVIIGSKAISEGYSFRNVIFEAINTPHWNYSEIAQALARGTRLGSHNDLIRAGFKPVVRIMQPVSIPADKTRSIDLYLYEISEDKDISIRSILRILMENAFDCALNYMRNYVEGVDNSRDCDYTTCQYKCDGIDIAEIENGLDDKELDYSTYQLYYANPKTPLIRRRIEGLFRQNHKLDMKSIVKNLTNEFTEEEITNALYIMKEESENDEFDYKTFLKLYSRSPVKEIMNELEEMFKYSFHYSFNVIVDTFKDYTTFEILSALQTIINDNLTLTNKYGLPSYLREDKNVYFLVNSLSIKPNFYVEYYTKFPQLSYNYSFDEIMNKIYSLSLPSLVKKICKIDDVKQFTKMMKSLPPIIQEMFIEGSIDANEKKIQINKELRDWILDLFNSYIKKIDDVWVSTFLDVLRCKRKGEKWTNCGEQYKQLIKEYEVERQQKLRENNPYGIMGKFNPENGSFCIVDFQKEKDVKTQLGGKRKKGEADMRLSYSGKVCSAGGWKLDDLVEIAVNRLKINPPENFRKGESEKKLLRDINKDEKLSSLLSENPTVQDMRRILYWGTSKKDKGNRGIKPICIALQEWFKLNNLLEIDNQCGVQGKPKVGTEKKEEKSRTFRIESIIPSKKPNKLKDYSKDIAKLMEESFQIKKYQVPEDDNRWILVFSRKKLVGFFMIDEDNLLSNVCVAKNYRRQGIQVEAMSQANQYICENTGKQPILLVDNRDKDFKKNIKLYETYGFEIIKTDEKDRFTYMQHKCK